MLSRVADNLYWISRYLERAEHTARLIDVHLTQMLDQAGGDTNLRWQRLLRSLRTPQPPEEVDAYSVTYALTFDEANTSSIVSCIASARENARQARQQTDRGSHCRQTPYQARVNAWTVRRSGALDDSPRARRIGDSVHWPEFSGSGEEEEILEW